MLAGSNFRVLARTFKVYLACLTIRVTLPLGLGIRDYYLRFQNKRFHFLYYFSSASILVGQTSARELSGIAFHFGNKKNRKS